ncbi:hypothetical protein [Streptomyces yangpuensis]|uniref:hypothetical protein n=1 Tax=Streptomyces yangpuensis TaxID=1648182 RepID=UPI003723A582
MDNDRTQAVLDARIDAKRRRIAQAMYVWIDDWAAPARHGSREHESGTWARLG